MSVSIFPDPYHNFEAMFPDYKEEFCYSPYLQRHLWEYNCLTFDLNSITDPQDRCRYGSLDLMTEFFFFFFFFFCWLFLKKKRKSLKVCFFMLFLFFFFLCARWTISKTLQMIPHRFR